jgi:hypothetical protein
MSSRTRGIGKLRHKLKQEIECTELTTDGRIKGHVYINLKAKNKDFNYLCYVAGNL